MYNRNRYSRYGGNWYQSVFWLVIGILIGQFLRFDIRLQDSSAQVQSTIHTAQLQRFKND